MFPEGQGQSNPSVHTITLEAVDAEKIRFSLCCWCSCHTYNFDPCSLLLSTATPWPW